MANTAARVVIADDEAVIRDLVSRIVLEAGHELLGIAKDGTEAVSMCRKLKPDLLLLDVYMPGMSGIKALRELSKDGPMPCTIVLTAEHQSEIVEDCFHLGAVGCAHKDTNMKELPAIIQSCLGSRGG